MNACSACHGKIIDKYITYAQWYQEELIARENVPAEVCETYNCFARNGNFLSAFTLWGEILFIMPFLTRRQAFCKGYRRSFAVYYRLLHLLMSGL